MEKSNPCKLETKLFLVVYNNNKKKLTLSCRILKKGGLKTWKACFGVSHCVTIFTLIQFKIMAIWKVKQWLEALKLGIFFF